MTGGTWLVGTISDPENLIPLVATDSASYDVIGMVYCRLLRYDGKLELTGDVATRWEVLDDGLRLRFHLNPEARWHDGVPVTASDVLFTIEVLRNPEVPSPYKGYVDKLERMVRIDEHTVEAVYSEPYARALDTWAGSFYLLPRHLLEGEDLLSTPYARRPVGCGPYRFRNWVSKRSVELERNPDWHGDGPRIAGYRLQVIPDQASMFLELLAGGLDQMGLTAQQYAQQTRDRRFRERFDTHAYTGFNYTYLGFNLQPERSGAERFEGFRDVRVRRALAHAIDKREIVDGVLFGLGEPTSGPFRPGMWYTADDVDEPAYDPDRARALLEEAGWVDENGDGIRTREGKPFRFTLLTNQGNRSREQVGQILQDRFRAIGVQADLRIVEWSTFLTEFVDRFNFDAVILGWSTGIDPDQYEIWHSSRTGPRQFNFVGFANDEVDALLEQGRSTFDRDERQQVYRQIHRILAAEQPYVFLFVPQSLPAVHKRVRGIVPDLAGIGYNFHEWWIPEAHQGLRRAP